MHRESLLVVRGSCSRRHVRRRSRVQQPLSAQNCHAESFSCITNLTLAYLYSSIDRGRYGGWKG